MFSFPTHGLTVKVEGVVMEDTAAIPPCQESLTRLQQNEYPVSQPISRREAMGAAWAILFVVSIMLLGFRVGIPVAAGAYSIFVVRFAKRTLRRICTACAVVFLYVPASGFMSAFHPTFAGKISWADRG